MAAPFAQNEDGVWCEACGDLIFAPWHDEYDDQTAWPDECRACGWPEDIDKMAEYFV